MNIDKELKRHFIARLIENDRRIDGRGLEEIRPISIETNVIDDKAEGSARVKLGNTDVICGIKILLGTPYPDNPNSGVMMTGVELSPIASPDFEMGRPGDNAIELARVVDRGIRESHMIDLDKLCIIKGEKVWMVSIDLHILNYDGNMFDACTLAVLAALKTAWVPKYDKENDAVIREKDKDLPLTVMPIAFTFAKIGNKIVLDPSLDEEYAMDTRLTISVTDKTLHAMQKGENGAWTSKEISDLVDKAMSKYKEVKKLIK
jgi:exosome complex component RRP42